MFIIKKQYSKNKIRELIANLQRQVIKIERNADNLKINSQSSIIQSFKNLLIFLYKISCDIR